MPHAGEPPALPIVYSLFVDWVVTWWVWGLRKFFWGARVYFNPPSRLLVLVGVPVFAVEPLVVGHGVGALGGFGHGLGWGLSIGPPGRARPPVFAAKFIGADVGVVDIVVDARDGGAVIDEGAVWSGAEVGVVFAGVDEEGGLFFGFDDVVVVDCG